MLLPEKFEHTLTREINRNKREKEREMWDTSWKIWSHRNRLCTSSPLFWTRFALHRRELDWIRTYPRLLSSRATELGFRYSSLKWPPVTIALLLVVLRPREGTFFRMPHYYFHVASHHWLASKLSQFPQTQWTSRGSVSTED